MMESNIAAQLAALPVRVAITLPSGKILGE